MLVLVCLVGRGCLLMLDVLIAVHIVFKSISHEGDARVKRALG